MWVAQSQVTELGTASSSLRYRYVLIKCGSFSIHLILLTKQCNEGTYKINLICVVTQITFFFFVELYENASEKSQQIQWGMCECSVPVWAGALRHWASVSASSVDLLVKARAYMCKDAQFQLLLYPYNCWKGLKNKSVFRVWPLTKLLGLALSLLLYIGKDSKRWFIHGQIFLQQKLWFHSMWQLPHFVFT